MRVLDLMLKDLRQVFGDKRALIFLLAMPMVFTLFMGFAYKSGSDNVSADTRIPLGWVNRDPDGLLSNQLHEMLSQLDTVKLVDLSPEALDDSVRKGEVAGALVVPERFSEQAVGGSNAQLKLIADTMTPQGQSIYQLLRTTITRLMSSAEIARLSAETAGEPAEFNPSFEAASRAWMETDSASLVRVEMAVAESQPSWYGDTPYNQASPGILVQFAIFGLVSSAQILVQERKTRTLQRMMTTSLRPWQIVAGHTLAMFVGVFIQVIVLVVFGQLALGVNYARAPLGILAVSVSLGLWVAALGLLIGILAKDDSQVVLFSLIAMFIFAAMGGTWFPLDSTSGAFSIIGKLMPSAWAMTGYQNILMRGLGSASAVVPALILLAYALGFFALAVWRFMKMEI